MTPERSIQIETDSEAQTLALAIALAKQLRAGDVLALEGPLGSGKTRFVRGLAQGLGIDPHTVSSPTFIILQRYSQSASPSNRTTGSRQHIAVHESRDSLVLFHIDAYRLSGPDELDTIGFTELLESPDAIIAIEWPSRIASALNDIASRRIDITFAHTGMHSRSIHITGSPEFMTRAQEADLGASNRNPRREAASDDAMTSSIACRTCGKPIAPDDPMFPFCSQRCKLADLGKWFNENYKVTRPAETEDLEAGE